MKKLFLLIIIIIFTISFSFKCGHNQIKKPPKIVNNSIIKNNNKTRNLETYHPISFYIDYSTMDKYFINFPNEPYQNFLKSAINSTLEIFSQLLKVKRKGNLRIPPPYECSGKINYYNREIREGIDNDIIIFPIIDRYLDDGVDAAASGCFLNKEDYRPIMGYVLLRKDYSFTKLNAKEYFIMLLLHEITHILVFDNFLYDYYIYRNITTTKIINGVNRTFITTPKVKNIASQHFNCSDIIGVELENHGGSGSAGSHWEGRVMLGDYMISTDYHEIVISDITLALFEDSGWYEVNYYTGGLFRFGKNQGCNFLNTTCLTSGKSNFEWEFCDNEIDEICSSNNLNRGYCYIKNYDKDLDSYYQYFDDKRKGGMKFMDYCPVAENYYSEEYYFNSNCINGEKDEIETNYPSSLGFSISENSICIQSSLIKSSDDNLKEYAFKRAMCHKILCNSNNQTIKVDIGEYIIECPKEGGEMEIDGYNGTIKCPPYNRVCTNKNFINDPLKAVLNHITNSDLDYSFKYDIPDVIAYSQFLVLFIYKYLLIFMLLF